jgi:hypothetical protein
MLSASTRAIRRRRARKYRLVGDIYTLCRLVVIWIGEHDALTEFAFKAVDFMASRWQQSQGKFNYYDWKQVQRGEKSDGRIPLKHRFEGMASGAAFSSLFSRPWFQRVWVIQEAVLPSHAVVMCGRF